MVWQVQAAKAHLSEVLEHAEREGPQMITKHGREWAVVVSIEEYRRLTQHRPDFRDFLLSGPKVDELTVERDRDTGREVVL